MWTTEMLVLPKYQMYRADSGDLGEGTKLGRKRMGISQKGNFSASAFHVILPLSFLLAKEFTWTSKRETSHTSTWRNMSEQNRHMNILT